MATYLPEDYKNSFTLPYYYQSKNPSRNVERAKCSTPLCFCLFLSGYTFAVLLLITFIHVKHPGFAIGLEDLQSLFPLKF